MSITKELHNIKKKDAFALISVFENGIFFFCQVKERHRCFYCLKAKKKERNWHVTLLVVALLA